mgnify:CR=1 FL=1
MAYIYESDVGRLGGNLQKTVGYLLSLHKAEYEWNLLGIKVVGHVDALPIPDGTYEYGDAYMVGTAAPYDMWIYTRADAFHSEAYWFNIGKFPALGPQGPKGDGLEQIIREASNPAQSVTYNSTSGATIEYAYKVLIYKDSTTGEIKTQTYPAQLSFPILPGKYISMDATSDNKKMEVKVDATELALDFFKIDKSAQAAVSAPVYVPQAGTTSPMYVTSDVIKTSIASRDSKGDCSFHKLNFEYIGFKDGGSEIDYFSLYSNTVGSDYGIEKTPTDTGTLTNSQLVLLQNTNQAKNLRIVYDNQVYYRMDPQGAPDGTLNYIHIDSIQDGNSGYTMTGKCFSVTVSTRAWQVVDLNFGKDYTHNIYMDDPASNTTIMFTVQSKRPTAYENISDLAAVVQRISFIPCVVEPGIGDVKAGYITADNTKFTVKTDAEYNYTFNQVTVQDTVS